MPAPAVDGTGTGNSDQTAPASLSDVALAAAERGLHVFPVDHPGQPACIGAHKPGSPCDGQRGKHPAVAWSTWAATNTPQMIEMGWRKFSGTANVGIACGPSGLVVLDEDGPGEVARWCDARGIALPDTYTVDTGRGKHYYFAWDHEAQRIGNSDRAFRGYEINVRGDGGYVVGAGSVHESGTDYTGNGLPIAPLPPEVAAILLAGSTEGNDRLPSGQGTGQDFWQPVADPNTTMIADGQRHYELVRYAGRLRGKGLDYAEAEALLRARWLLCEQPEGQIPEGRFHSPTCRYPVTWDEARGKLRDVYDRYPPSDSPPGDGQGERMSGETPAAWQFVDGGSFILDIPATTPACWGSRDDVLWAEGESLMVAGPMGLGKTTLALRLLRARLGLDTGELLGYPVAPCEGVVLYLAMDRPAQIARAAYRMCSEDEREVLRDRVKFWPGPPPADVARHPEVLTELADAAGAADVVLDSIKDAAIGLSEDEVGAGYNRARQALLASGRQLCELHHTVKRGGNGGAPTDVADIYGSTWLTNGTGSILLLSGDPGDALVGLRHVRQPANEVGPLELLHDQDAGLITVNDRTDLVALAVASGVDGLLTKTAAAAVYSTDNPTPAQVENARRRLMKLTEQGRLVMVEGETPARGGKKPRAWFPVDGWAG